MQHLPSECMKNLSIQGTILWYNSSIIWESVNNPPACFHMYCWLFVGGGGNIPFIFFRLIFSPKVSKSAEKWSIILQIFLRVCYKVCIISIQQILNQTLKVLGFDAEPFEIERSSWCSKSQRDSLLKNMIREQQSRLRIYIHICVDVCDRTEYKIDKFCVFTLAKAWINILNSSPYILKEVSLLATCNSWQKRISLRESLGKPLTHYYLNYQVENFYC